MISWLQKYLPWLAPKIYKSRKPRTFLTIEELTILEGLLKDPEHDIEHLSYTFNISKSTVYKVKRGKHALQKVKVEAK